MGASSWVCKLFSSNSYFSTAGRRGPVCPDKVASSLKNGLQQISESDKFLRNFSVTNPNIAHASERWYGRDIAQRALLGNASDRHRCIVDMGRNNDGGFLRAIFSKAGQLKKTLSVAKDKTSVSAIYDNGYVNGLGAVTFVKKVVRAADGQKIREVYTVAAKNNPKNFFSFIVDSTKGLKKIISSQKGASIFKQGDVIEYCANGVKQMHTSVAGVNSNLKYSFDALKSQGWVKFLENSINSCYK